MSRHPRIFFDLASLQFYFLELIHEGWKNARTEIEWIEEYRKIETQKITGASAEKLIPERGVRMLQDEARIPRFMSTPYHLGICAAPAGSVNKLDALV